MLLCCITPLIHRLNQSMSMNFKADDRIANSTGKGAQNTADTLNARLDDIRTKQQKRLSHILKQQAAEQQQINDLLRR